MGSREEMLAINSLTRQRHAQFMTTLAVVNAIIHIGNGIISAVGGGSQSNSDSGKLEKTLESLRDLLIPEDKGEKEGKAEKAMRILKEEVEKGPLKVRAMSGGKTKGRIIRHRREDVPGTTQS